jgi:hypothetical protein
VPGFTSIRDYSYLGSKLVASIDAPKPSVAFTTATSVVREGTTSTTATIRLTTPGNQPLGYPVTVAYSTADAGATAGHDYVAASASVTFGSEATTGAERTVTVTLIDDAIDENDEAFSLNLSTPSGADLGLASHTVTLRDNEPHLVAQIEIPGLGGTTVVPGAIFVRGWAIDSHAASGT